MALLYVYCSKGCMSWIATIPNLLISSRYDALTTNQNTINVRHDKVILYDKTIS